MASLLDFFMPQKRTTIGEAIARAYWGDDGGHDPSGVMVSESSAMGIAAYWACIRNISEDVAKLPIRISRPRKDGGRESLPTHPLLPLINRRPNPDMTAMSFWETMYSHALGYKGAFAEIVRDNAGNPRELWPLDPRMVEIRYNTETGELFYIVSMKDTGQRYRLDSGQVFHMHGLGHDAITAFVIAQICRTSIGAIIATQNHAAGFFGNSTILSGLLQAPAGLSEQAMKNLAATFKLRHQGSAKAYGVPILPDGVTWKDAAVDAQKSQLVESQEFGVEQACRMFRMPPNKVQHLKRSTYSNIEEENRSYSIDTLHPWTIRGDQEIQRKLLGRDEADTVIVEHDFGILLEADVAAKTDAQLKQFQMGQYTINDLLKAQNREPVDDEGADDRFVMAQLMPLRLAVNPQDRLGAAQTPTQSKEDTQADDDVAKAFSGLFAEDFRKWIRIEEETSMAQMKRGKHAAWMGSYYPRHREHVAQVLETRVRACRASVHLNGDAAKLAESIALEYVEAARERIASGSRNDSIIPAEEFAAMWGENAVKRCMEANNHG